MKSLFGLAIAGLMLAGSASADDSILYGPVPPAPGAGSAPLMAPGYPVADPAVSGPAYRGPVDYGHPAPAPVVTRFGGPVVEIGHGLGPAGGPLFGNVRYKDLDNIHPFAVEKVVTVPMRYKKSCFHRGTPLCTCGPDVVCVKICVPPCACLDVDTNDYGNKVKYDYGDYEVEIKAENGRVTVDYDD